MTFTIGRKTILVLVGIVVVTVTGMAFAAWVLPGTSGNAATKAGSATALTLGSAPAFTTGLLYPGGTGTVKLSVSNPNPFAVQITAVTQTASTSIVTSPTVAACDSSTGVTFATQSGLSISVPANAVDQIVSLTGAVSMSNASANACQGVTFVIPVDITATSA